MRDTKQPASQRAEESVIGTLLRSPEARLEIITTGGLEPEHLYFAPYRLAFEEIVERYYADDPIDPLVVAESIGPRAAERWGISEREAVDRILQLALPNGSETTAVREHAKIIRRHHAYRELVSITGNALQEAFDQERDPDEIAGVLSAAATRLVTGSLSSDGLLTYADMGRRWMQATREEIAARQAGVELGAFFGIEGLDSYIKGLRPTELMILGGDPGVGKTAIVMTMLRNFGLRQMRKPPERRVGSLYLCLEMGEKGSSDRFAQMESGISGEKLRMGTLTTTELRGVAERWAKNRELPIIAEFAGEMRESQIKAKVIEGIRRYQTGLVVIDHFRLINTDERQPSRTETDDQIVKFLKVMAKDLNVAVVCLAHTTKTEDRRPRMDDLRGSKMISALADIVAFPYSPWRNATREDRERGHVSQQELEVVFAKVRAAAEGTGELWVDLSRMEVR